ncbi:MAG: hypothetical protein MPJ24_01995 [Pirellulaceae bacterium]|nr:hypothetical protein [Pirellulaceae bacterium]
MSTLETTSQHSNSATAQTDHSDGPISPQTKEASAGYIGKWNGLISSTNWEKGKIICQWREALVATKAPTAEYSDETWAQFVGGVTGQHVGRLRRVYQRFGELARDFSNLFWSHYLVAIDWDDAETWLRRADTEKLSIAAMRKVRWQETDGDPATEPNAKNAPVSTELNEDHDPTLLQDSTAQNVAGEIGEILGPASEGADFGDLGEVHLGGEEGEFSSNEKEGHEEDQLVRPFEHLGDLPDDLAEAMENFKLVILHHKAANWDEVSQKTIGDVLDSLKRLATAPAEAPF